jgi:hypothetical protein
VPPELDDVALEGKLFTPAFGGGEPTRPQRSWSRLHAELRRPSVTPLLVWEEYRAGQADGYRYSPFCDLYATWHGRLSPTMRQNHPARERLFVDYAGQTVEVIDGAFLMVGLHPASIRAARRHLEAGAARVGRSLVNFPVVFVVTLDLGPDNEAGSRWMRSWFQPGQPFLSFPSTANLRRLAEAGFELDEAHDPSVIPEGRFLFPAHDLAGGYNMPEAEVEAFAQIMRPKFGG